jgi:hypothetical protein
MVNIILFLYPLDDSNNILVVMTSEISQDIAICPPGEKNKTGSPLKGTIYKNY